jgi:hypothetical protein
LGLQFLIRQRVFACEAAGILHNYVWGAFGYDVASMDACTWTHINQIVGMSHGVLVVLHYN